MERRHVLPQISKTAAKCAVSTWLFFVTAMLGCMIPAAPETWSDYQSQIIADPALVAYFDFREGSGDILDNRAKQNPELRGEIHQAAWTQGRWSGKSALAFGGSSYVEVPYHATLAFSDPANGGTGALTITLWLFAETNGESGIIDRHSGGWGLPNKETGEGGSPFVLWVSTKKTYAFVGTKTQTCAVKSAEDFPIGE